MIEEKPFGRDLESSRALTKALAVELSEKQTYRIDHCRKELIEKSNCSEIFEHHVSTAVE